MDGNRDATLTSLLGKTSGEPNGSFEDPIVAVFGDDGVARLKGTVSMVGDLDVYLLGPVEAGVRLVVDVSSNGSLLDTSIAVFDAGGFLVAENDDRGTNLQSQADLDSYIDFVTRHGGERYYVVVTHSAFAGLDAHTGRYTIDITKTTGQPVPPPVPQLLMLDFDGGSVDSELLGSRTIVPFDAGAIASVYKGKTDEMKGAIRAGVEQNYERFDVIVITSDDPPPPEGTEYSTVFLGGFHASAFGIAESVDLYNQDYCDDAIIFTESFTLSAFSRVPTVAEMGLAIANVAAHEAGHILGLNHVDNDLALMDDRSAADAFIADQEFMAAVLSDDIMPIGMQDAVLLLTEIVGLSELGMSGAALPRAFDAGFMTQARFQGESRSAVRRVRMRAAVKSGVGVPQRSR